MAAFTGSYFIYRRSNVCFRNLKKKCIWRKQMLVRNWSDTLKSSTLCYRSSVFWLTGPGCWRITKPPWRTHWRWLQKDGNTFWWTEQNPPQHGLYTDVLWRANCGTSSGHFLLAPAVVPWPSSPWTSCCPLPCHYLCTAVEHWTFGSHVWDW